MTLAHAKAMRLSLAFLDESKRAAAKADVFAENGERNEAFRTLGVAEGLAAAAARVDLLAREL